MSTASNSAITQSSFFETAEVRVVSRRPRPRSDYKLAYMLVSSRIYWRKVANEDETNKPQSFIDFRNADSVELVRLEDGTWNDVDGFVKVDNHNERRRIIVCGRPHGRTRLHTPLRGGNIQVEIIPNTPEQLERWVNYILGRIAPWTLLQQEVKNLTNLGPLCKTEEIERALGGFVTSKIGSQLSTYLMNKGEGKRTDNLGTLPEQMEKASLVDELIVHGTAVVETCAGLSKLVAEHVGETAEIVGNVTKCVAGVSTLFHLVALGAQVVSMCAEASRGRRVLLVLLGQIMVLLKYILESLSEIMKSSRKVNQIDTDFVFDVFRQAIDAIDIAETQLLRGRVGQVVNAGVVKGIERKVGELKQMAVIAGNTSKFCAVDERMDRFEEGEVWNDLTHHVRPSLSAFFSGRTKELNMLGDILEKHGSAVITQCGGCGKTELMIALADRAERDGVVPGGVFWVTVDGGENDVIESLGRLAEKLAQKKMDEDERRNPNMVIAALKQGLDGREGRWLLCLDNADDSRVSGILNEVCGIAEGKRGNGWIVVTSRQGQPHIWSRMKREQKLVLEPLCVEDAMVALWRQILKVDTDDANDDSVIEAIKKLEEDDAAEYHALKELCGDDEGCSFGGLPLALVQAGTYMARFNCSFSEYRGKLRTANKIEDMQHIMKTTEDVKLQKSQRSIWTTWRISVEQLSEGAYNVLRAMAMLGEGGVAETIVKGIVKRFTENQGRSVDTLFEELVIEELVHGSSLISQDEADREGPEGCIYKMHRLVRRFIVSGMERGSNLWNEVYSVALVTVHEVVLTALEKVDKSFAVLPDVIGKDHDEFVAHALALVDHQTLPAEGAEVRDILKVIDIHQYCGKATKFMGKAQEQVHVWERLVGLLHHQEPVNPMKNCNSGSLDLQKEMKIRIAAVYRSLGLALMENGRLNEAASKLKQSLELKQIIHGHDTPHPAIAVSLDNLGRVYERQANLNKALEMHERSLEMNLAIHGENTPHHSIAISLANLGRVHEWLGNLDKASEKHEQSLRIKLAIHGHDKPHLSIAISLDNIGRVHERLGNFTKALEKYEEGLEMKLAIHGRNTPHSSIAFSLVNFGRVYERQGDLERAMENHEKCLAMRRAIYGPDKPHPYVAKTLRDIGVLYHKQGNLSQAVKFLEQSHEMLRIVFSRNSLHPDIIEVLQNLADVYVDQGRRDEALVIRRNLPNTGTGEASDCEASNPGSRN